MLEDLHPGLDAFIERQLGSLQILQGLVHASVGYRKSNERLEQVEDVLERVAAHPDSSDALGRWVNRALPDNGRIMGAYMARGARY